MRSLCVMLCALALVTFDPAGARARGVARLAERDGRWWLVRPDGTEFFSLGVNVVTPGASRDAYRAELPQYAAFRQYDSNEAWADATLERMKSWGFNTVGGWSHETVRRGQLPYTVVLDLGATVSMPWGDVFSLEAARAFDEKARRLVAPLRDDPNLVGYFTDNELGWWPDSIFAHFLGEPSENATRRELMRLLREHYRGDFRRLTRDFDAGSARSFDDLDRKAALVVRPGGGAMQVIEAFVGRVAERYYRLASESIRRYDPDHLILGDRYLGWYVPAVARAAGRHCDVVSVNYAAEWLDGSTSHFFLDSLHRLTNRPLLISEFYFAATENRSGNKNSSANFPTVATQPERAASFSRELRDLAGRPYVVGAHWFQYFDEPTHGRATDGEDYDMGLVDIDDRPYQELVTAASSIDTTVEHRRARAALRRRATPRLPRAPDEKDALRGLECARAVVPTATAAPCADMYAWWDERNLYLAVNAADYVDERIYANGTIPSEERMRWTVEVGGRAMPLSVRLGAKRPAELDGTATMREWSASVRDTVFLTIPVRSLGLARLRAGAAIPVRATLTTHGRAQRVRWRTTLRLGD